MPLSLRTKDELKLYAFQKWRMLHLASNYFDLVYDSLDTQLTHDEKVGILKKLVDWWASPQYLRELGGDTSAQNVLSQSKRYARRLQEEVLRQSSLHNKGAE